MFRGNQKRLPHKCLGVLHGNHVSVPSILQRKSGEVLEAVHGQGAEGIEAVAELHVFHAKTTEGFRGRQ